MVTPSLGFEIVTGSFILLFVGIGRTKCVVLQLCCALHYELCCASAVFALHYELCCALHYEIFCPPADVQVGDSEEDAEARSLLNKFLGAQVILQGMEPLVKASQSHSAALVSQVERQRVLTTQKVGKGTCNFVIYSLLIG
jgi:hypothetical protein